MLTNSELKQIIQYLKLHSKKDSQLPSLDDYTPDMSQSYINDGDYLPIVQGGVNKTVTLKNLEKSFLDTFLTDPAFNDYISDTVVDNSDKLVKSDGIYNFVTNGENIIGTIQIKDDNITWAKLANGSVYGTKIQDGAITTDKLEDNAVTTIKIVDNSITTDKIKDKNITNSKLADDNISWEKFDHDVQTRINTHTYGPSLSTNYGDSDEVGITQKTLTEFKDDFDNLKNTVYDIHYQPGFSVNHSVVFKDTTTTVTATASLKFNGVSETDFTATTPEGWTVGTTIGTTRTFTKSVNTTQSVQTTIKKDNYSKHMTASITAVDHIYYGAGASDAILNTSDMIDWSTPLISPSFTITSLHTNQNDYIYFEVPDTMNIAKVLIWDNPSLPTEISFSSVATSREGYKAYKSNTSRAEGTHSYKVS